MRRSLLGALAGALLLPLATGCPKSGEAAQAQRAAQDPLAAARAAKTAGHADEAMRDCREALAQSPKRLDAWRLLVQLYAEASRLSEITAELTVKSTAAPQDDALHSALGLADFAQPATAGEPALHELTQAMTLRPTEPEYAFRLGVARYELERYDEALPALRQAVALDAKQARFHVPLGLTLAKLGQRDAALAEFRTLLSLQPTARDVQLAQKALERLDDPLREIPKAEEQNVQKGMDWLYQADAPQQAIDAFQDVLDRYPDLAPVHALIGLAYERLDDVGPAVEHLRRAIELKPDDAHPYLYLGELYFSKQKPEPATGYFQKALERNPLLERAYARLGALAMQRSDAKAALTAYHSLVVLQPEDAGAHKAMAQAHELAGEYDQAEAELQGILSRDPKELDARLRLGFLYAALAQRLTGAADRDRRRAQAQKTFGEVLDQQPENVAASRALQELQAGAPPKP
jgi:tetratricopeptide (TPR) repeat protein